MGIVPIGKKNPGVIQDDQRYESTDSQKQVIPPTKTHIS
jgi:hypothetical protein